MRNAASQTKNRTMVIDRTNILLNLIMVVLLILGCGDSNNSLRRSYFEHRSSALPPDVRSRMDSVVFAITGRDIFARYFVLDSTVSGLFRGDDFYKKENTSQQMRYLAFDHYLVQYWFRIPDKPWRRTRIVWNADLQGTVIPSGALDQIPQCINDPTDCKFQIDSSDAIAIAKNAGIPEGLRPIHALFAVLPFKGRVVWVVSSTTELRDQPLFSRDTVYYVDTCTGEVLSRGSGEVVE